MRSLGSEGNCRLGPEGALALASSGHRQTRNAAVADWTRNRLRVVLVKPRQCIKDSLWRGATGHVSGSCGRELEPDFSSPHFSRNHEFFNGLDELLNCGVVSLEVVLQLVDFGCELLVGGDHLTQSYEGSNHENIHLDGPLGIKHRRSHDRSVLCKCVGQIGSVATLGLEITICDLKISVSFALS